MLAIANKTRRNIANKDRKLFKKIHENILGKDYELSIVICTDKISPHNVLAYPLSKKEGEIFLNPQRAKTEAKNFKRDTHEHLLVLFAHACLHLAGLKHGRTMERLEQKYANPQGS